MKYSILIAAFMTFANFNEYGMVIFSVWLATLLVICSVDILRNFMFGFYVVGGFWYFLAG